MHLYKKKVYDKHLKLNKWSTTDLPGKGILRVFSNMRIISCCLTVVAYKIISIITTTYPSYGMYALIVMYSNP